MIKLERASNLASSLGCDVTEWPQLWSEGPPSAVSAGKRFLDAIGPNKPSSEIAWQDARTALDEWLLSSEKRRLSKNQRIVCACALLELITVTPMTNQNDSDVFVAFETIIPSIDSLTHKIRIELSTIVQHVMNEREAIGLVDFEFGLLSILNHLLRKMLDTETAVDDLPDLLVKLQTSAFDYGDELQQVCVLLLEGGSMSRQAQAVARNFINRAQNG